VYSKEEVKRLLAGGSVPTPTHTVRSPGVRRAARAAAQRGGGGGGGWQLRPGDGQGHAVSHPRAPGARPPPAPAPPPPAPRPPRPLHIAICGSVSVSSRCARPRAHARARRGPLTTRGAVAAQVPDRGVQLPGVAPQGQRRQRPRRGLGAAQRPRRGLGAPAAWEAASRAAGAAQRPAGRALPWAGSAPTRGAAPHRLAAPPAGVVRPVVYLQRLCSTPAAAAPSQPPRPPARRRAPCPRRHARAAPTRPRPCMPPPVSPRSRKG